MGDDFFQALANPYRREVIRLLKRAEIITAERRGNQILYTLNLSVVQEMVVQLTDLLGRKEEPCHETE